MSNTRTAVTAVVPGPAPDVDDLVVALAPTDPENRYLHLQPGRPGRATRAEERSTMLTAAAAQLAPAAITVDDVDVPARR